MRSSFDYDEIPTAYYDDVYRRHTGIQSKWHHMKFDFLQQLLKPSNFHLDIACGSGTFLGSLRNTKSTHVGIDISLPQISEAQYRYGERNKFFLQSDAAQLPFPTDCFDIVTVVELIEHLPISLVKKTLDEVFRILRPGGSLILSTPNYRSLIWVIEPMIGWFGEVSYKDQHITKFTKARLQQTLQGVGFQEISIQGFMFFAPFSAFLGWKVPDYIAQLEPNLLRDRFGLLLSATVKKPI